MKRIFITIWLITIYTIHIHSQIVERPNSALKSHETLEISKVEITTDKTIVFMTIENRIEGGNFCADRNIYLIEPDGQKLKLKKSTGIPVCPDTHKFKSIGEKLQFKLEFPALRKGTGWIDIVEGCNDNCFSFYGVALNTELNSRINDAFSLAEKGAMKGAITLYEKIIENLSKNDEGIKGALYSDIISLSIESGDKVSAGNWYKKLVSSNVPRLEMYIKNLNSRGIKF